MSQTATVVETEVKENKNTKHQKSGRGELLPKYEAKTKNKDGKDIHWQRPVVRKRELKHYVKNARGSTVRRSRVSKNLYASVKDNQRLLKSGGVDMPKVGVKKGAVDTAHIVLDGVFNYMVQLQGEQCYNQRNGHTSQLTRDIAGRTWHLRGFY
jgi:hypothetical protein